MEAGPNVGTLHHEDTYRHAVSAPLAARLFDRLGIKMNRGRFRQEAGECLVTSQLVVQQRLIAPIPGNVDRPDQTTDVVECCGKPLRRPRGVAYIYAPRWGCPPPQLV